MRCLLDLDYLASRRPNPPPEQKLWLAVLNLAVEDLQSVSAATRAKARLWLEASPDVRLVLELAGLDAAWRPLLRDYAQQPPTRAPLMGDRLVERDGVTRPAREWAAIRGVSVATIVARLNRGLPPELALPPTGRQRAG